MVVKSFRGSLADGAQDKVPLHTNDGRMGYRITKFELFPPAPGATGQESVVKVYNTVQSTVDGLVDFSDNQLLGVAFGSTMTGEPSVHPQTLSVTFDNHIFNQDMFITHSEVNGTAACNYYIELEEVRLSSLEATVVTLKDMRGR
jgi:hypothetical protein